MKSKYHVQTIFVSLIAVVLSVTVVMAMTGCTFAGSAEEGEPESAVIEGTWFSYAVRGITDYIFYDDGTYVTFFEGDDSEQIAKDKAAHYKYSYDVSSSLLSMEDTEGTVTYKAALTADKLKLTGTGDYKSMEMKLYRTAEAAKLASPAYYTSDEFCNSIKDSKGFCIRKGILYAYMGKAKKITIPSTVRRIYMDALSGDFGHGVNLKKVIVPGSVKQIDKNAFAFTNADVIVIREGVKTIKSTAFMDSYIDKIYFPRSLTRIGTKIMETEEGLDGTRIYVYKNSRIHKYFKQKKNQPYGRYKLIFR